MEKLIRFKLFNPPGIEPAQNALFWQFMGAISIGKLFKFPMLN